jgi:hypothetical protein
VWGAPALITAGVLAAIVPRHDIAAAGQGGDWRPDWRNIRVWKLGLLQATATLGYFGGSTFIPGYLHATHRPELVAAALAGLSLGQLPGVLLFGLLPASRLTNARPALILGSGMLVALATLLIASGLGFVLAAALLGACSAAALALALALPPLVAAPTDVPRRPTCRGHARSRVSPRRTGWHRGVVARRLWLSDRHAGRQGGAACQADCAQQPLSSEPRGSQLTGRASRSSVFAAAKLTNQLSVECSS